MGITPNRFSGSVSDNSLTVRTVDALTSVSNVKTIIVSNGTLTNNGAGTVSIITGGGGGGSVSITSDNTGTTFVDATVSPSPITGTGTISADLNATGTADATTFLRGDNTWAVPSGGGISGTIADTQVAYGTAADTVGGDANFTWDSSRQLLGATYSTLANVYEVIADVDISKGEAVYTTGFNGGSGKPQVDLAQSNSSATMPAIGIAAADITAGQTGLVIIDGQLDGVTTSGSANDIIYVSSTVAGAVTNVRPTGATELVQNMGNIIKVGAGGKIAVTATGTSNDVPNSFSILGSISAGSLTLTTPLAVADGGTGATTDAGARTNLGLGTMATQDANAVAITGGTITGVTGLAEPSTGSLNQFNVADGSGGWDPATVYYHTAGSGGIKIGSSSLPNYAIAATSGSTNAFVGRFVSQLSQSKLAFVSSTTTSNSAAAIGTENSRLLLVSNGTDYLFPSSDGSSGEAMVTNGSGSLSFDTVKGNSDFTNGTIVGQDTINGFTTGSQIITNNSIAAPTEIIASITITAGLTQARVIGVLHHASGNPGVTDSVVNIVRRINAGAWTVLSGSGSYSTGTNIFSSPFDYVDTHGASAGDTVEYAYQTSSDTASFTTRIWYSPGGTGGDWLLNNISATEIV